jgi:hypothetical protein
MVGSCGRCWASDARPVAHGRARTAAARGRRTQLGDGSWRYASWGGTYRHPKAHACQGGRTRRRMHARVAATTSMPLAQGHPGSRRQTKDRRHTARQEGLHGSSLLSSVGGSRTSRIPRTPVNPSLNKQPSQPRRLRHFFQKSSRVLSPTPYRSWFLLVMPSAVPYTHSNYPRSKEISPCPRRGPSVCGSIG